MIKLHKNSSSLFCYPVSSVFHHCHSKGSVIFWHRTQEYKGFLFFPQPSICSSCAGEHIGGERLTTTQSKCKQDYPGNSVLNQLTEFQCNLDLSSLEPLFVCFLKTRVACYNCWSIKEYPLSNIPQHAVSIVRVSFCNTHFICDE